MFMMLALVMTCAFFLYEQSVQNSIEDSHNSKMPVESESDDASADSHSDRCHPRNGVLLLKTHKTGSSTVQNILLRYGDQHKLRMVLPPETNYFGHPALFDRRMLHSSQTSHKSKHAPSSNENKIFAFHARYNYPEMKAVMSSNTIFITVLREPVKLMESMIVYYNLPLIYQMKTPTEFMENFFSAHPSASRYHAVHTERFKKKYGRNQMAFDLGMDEKDFDDADKITDFIQSIESQFHLVMIAERMDESLILLKHLLCWTLEDMVSFPQNARINTSITEISGELEQRMRHYNKADQLLYEYFSAKLDRQVEEFGAMEMKREVASLRDASRSMYEQCVGQTVSKNLNFAPIYAKNQVNVKRYKAKEYTNKTCELLTMAEFTYLGRLRRKQNEVSPNKESAGKKKPNIVSADDLRRLLHIN